jgi:hypothetical protein
MIMGPTIVAMKRAEMTIQAARAAIAGRKQ